MKRDIELVRSILLDVEAAEPGKPIFGFAYDGKSEAEVMEHVAILVDAGYLDGSIITDGMNQPSRCVIHKLTWSGHEFLGNAKNDAVWRKVMTQVGERTSSISIEVLKALLVKAAARFYGLPE